MNCRTCLMACEPREAQSIFAALSSDGKISLADMLLKLAHVEAHIGDGLSEYVCITCSSDLLYLNEFVTKCQESDSSLSHKKIRRSPSVEEIFESGGKRIVLPIRLKVEVDSDEEEKETVFLPPKPEYVQNGFGQRTEASDMFTGHTSTVLPNGILNYVTQNVQNKTKEGAVGNCWRQTSPPRTHMMNSVQKQNGQTALTDRKDRRGMWHRKIGHFPKGEYKCDWCEKVFEYYSQMRIHSLRHTAHASLECKDCGKKFKQKANLQAHEERHRSKRPLPCSYCNKSFFNNGHLQTHLEKEHAVPALQLECEYCGRSFKHRSQLNVHLERHSQTHQQACNHCDMIFLNMSHLARHVELIHGNMQCNDLPNGRLSRHHSAKGHRSLNGPDDPVITYYHSLASNTTSSNELSMNGSVVFQEQYNSTDPGRYHCQICEESFSSYLEFTNHGCTADEQLSSARQYLNNLNDNNRSFECYECGKTFYSNSAFMRHMTSHQ